MNREECRKKIDDIDTQLVSLFEQRMQLCKDIANYKAENHLPVFDAVREREKIAAVRDLSSAEIREYTPLLYSTLFELSRSYQNKVIGYGNELADQIKTALKNTPELFPIGVSVACQGTEGAYAQLACDKLIDNANILYFNDFDAVFSAIDKGLCKYGIVPVENSTAGTVNAVYDLMNLHHFKIVRSVRVKVDHQLLANRGATLDGIKEIYSHEQAIQQCSQFLSSLKDVKIIPCENTAVAAKKVAESGRKDVAALCSRSCMDLYGLDCLKESVQQQQNNYTRFICIGKDLEIFPGADRTSIMAVLPHKAGSLYHLLSRFYALGINLNKLESRPLPDRDFEFMFYFDLDIPVYSEKLLQLMGELSTLCESFNYLGSYSEVI